MTEGTDFFDNIGGKGAPSAKLKDLNDFVMGEVVDFFKRDYVPFGKTDPEKNADGTTRQQLVIILQTESRNWANVSKIPKVDVNDPNSADKPASDDDGKRAVYVPERSNIHYAVGQALSAAKARIEPGGKLGVKIFNLKDTGKGNPLKEHQAVYEKPVADAGFFAKTETPAAQAPASEPAAAPAAAPAPAATPAASGQVDPWTGQAAAPAAAPPF